MTFKASSVFLPNLEISKTHTRSIECVLTYSTILHDFGTLLIFLGATDLVGKDPFNIPSLLLAIYRQLIHLSIVVLAICRNTTK